MLPRCCHCCLIECRQTCNHKKCDTNMHCTAAGEMLITGGLGALGILTALWAALSSGGGGSGSSDSAAASGSTSHIQLLSRSGRPSRDALQPGSPLRALLSGPAGRSGVGASMTMRRCDAASAEEAAAALRSRSCAGSMLLHAAGVLQVICQASQQWSAVIRLLVIHSHTATQPQNWQLP